MMLTVESLRENQDHVFLWLYIHTTFAQLFKSVYLSFWHTFGIWPSCSALCEEYQVPIAHAVFDFFFETWGHFFKHNS